MSNPYAPPQGPREGGTAGDGRDRGDSPSAPAGGEGRDRPGRARRGQGGSSPGPGPQRPPDAVTQELNRRIGHFAMFMVATLLTMVLPLPWKVGAVVLGIGAVVAGARALATAWRGKVRGAVPALLGAGVAFAGLLVVSQLLLLALWPLEVERQECLRRALTVSAQEACEQQFTESVTERFDRATGDLSG